MTDTTRSTSTLSSATLGRIPLYADDRIPVASSPISTTLPLAIFPYFKLNSVSQFLSKHHNPLPKLFTHDRLWTHSLSADISKLTETHVPYEHCVVDEQLQRRPSTGSISIFQDLIAGGIAGSASVIVGHPFDTVKVRLQTSAPGTSTSSLFGGFSSLYRGMGAPLSTAAIVNAIVFSSFGYSSRLWDEHMGVKEGVGSSDWKRNFICGSFGGFMQCLVICPTEHIKCRLQVKTSGTAYNGPFHVMSKIYSTQGIRGLYRGWYVTAWREIPAFGMYFAIYDSLKEKINDQIQSYDPTHSHSWVACAVAGGISGSATWALIYPFDVIKTKIQTSPLDSVKPSDRKLWHVGAKIVREHGWRFLFRGLSVTLVRAFPVNGIIFPVYEFILMQINN